MTRAQARLLILVLAMKRIPFVLRRNGNTYVVRFAAQITSEITAAMGA